MSSVTSWGGDDGGESLRLWLSEKQWMALLARIQRSGDDYEGPERRSARADRIPAQLRCVVRAQQPDGRSATYLVRSHNISAGGLGFVHGTPLPRGSRCTIALEKGAGHGLIASGRVAWARQIDDRVPHAFEVGIQFDRPIDPAPFVDGDAPPAAG